jgi:FkbM family methyltransferase
MKVTIAGRADRYLWKKLLRFCAGLGRAFALTVKVRDGADEYLFRPKTRNDIFRYTTYFTKEEGTLAWIRNNVREGTVFYDIGANVGLYSLYAAKRAPGVRVYSFEPHKINFATLVENILLNALGERVHPMAIALGDATGYFHLNYNSMDSGTSMSQLGHSSLPGNREFTPKLRELVHAVTLDSLVESGQIPAPDVIKVDVDGNEMKILAGMKRLLASDRGPRSLQVEINTGLRREVLPLMEGCGYRLDHCHFTKGGQVEFARTGSYDNVPHNAVFVKERAGT